MARPFIYIGSVMFISLTVFAYTGVNACAVSFCVGAAVIFVCLFIKNRSSFLKKLMLCCAALLLSSYLFTLFTITEYQPAINMTSETVHSLSGKLCAVDEQYGNYYYTLKNITADNSETKLMLRICSKEKISAETDDIINLTDVTVYRLGVSDSSQLQYKSDRVYIGTYDYTLASVEKSDKHSYLFYIEKIRDFMSETLYKNMYSDFASVAEAMLTGDTSKIDGNILLNFRYSGISHLFAVSGFHLSLWTGIIIYILSSIFKKHKNTALVLSIIFTLFFMALTGFSKSVMRAGIMMLIVLAGHIIRENADSVNSLFIALTLILTENPFAAVNISLQMSFLAALGIILLSPPLSSWLKNIVDFKNKRFLSKIIYSAVTAVIVSVTAMLFTLPVTAYSFGYFTAFAPLTNIICITPGEIFIFLAGVGIVFSFFPPVSKLIFYIASLLAKFLIFVTEKISILEGAVIKTDNIFMEILITALCAVAAAVLIKYTGKDKKLQKSFAVIVSALIVFSSASFLYEKKSFSVTAANVGNGTAVIICYNGENYLIGAGGSRQDYYLTNILDTINSRTVDLLLIPGNGSSESSYASAILNRYHVKNAVYSQAEYDKELLKSLPENSVYTNGFSASLDENTTLLYINNEHFNGARIVSDSFKCTVIFKSGSDFSWAPPSWSSGDLLITRYKLPKTNTSGFEKIFISTDSDIVYENENIYTTSEKDCLVYSVSPLGRHSVKEN